MALEKKKRRNKQRIGLSCMPSSSIMHCYNLVGCMLYMNMQRVGQGRKGGQTLMALIFRFVKKIEG